MGRGLRAKWLWRVEKKIFSRAANGIARARQPDA
jgi:hypothetical protein